MTRYLILIIPMVLHNQLNAMGEQKVIEAPDIKTYLHKVLPDTYVIDHNPTIRFRAGTKLGLDEQVATGSTKGQKITTAPPRQKDIISKALPKVLRENLTVPDDARKEVPDPTIYPFRCFGRLEGDGDSGPFTGTVALISESHALTCAHNVIDNGSKEWAKNLVLCFGLTLASAPWGRAKVARVYVPKQYIDDKNDDYDYAVLVLEEALGAKIGYVGCAYTMDEVVFENVELSVTGYPGNKVNLLSGMWTMSSNQVEFKPGRIHYQINTWQGNSGSPVWITGANGDTEVAYVVGIHTHGQGQGKERTGNSGVRITKDNLTQICHWIKETESIVPRGMPNEECKLWLKSALEELKNRDKAGKMRAISFFQQGVDNYPENTQFKEALEVMEVKNADEPSQGRGKTRLHQAVFRGDELIAEILLLTKEANPNVQEDTGFTPLHLAALRNDTSMIELLLRYKADKTILDKKKMMPKDRAKSDEAKKLLELDM